MAWQMITLSRRQTWGHDRVVYRGMIRIPLERALAQLRDRGWTWDIVDAGAPLPDSAYAGLAKEVLEFLGHCRYGTFGPPEYNDLERAAAIARKLGVRWEDPRR